jgi:hypothetical protein
MLIRKNSNASTIGQIHRLFFATTWSADFNEVEFLTPQKGKAQVSWAKVGFHARGFLIIQRFFRTGFPGLLASV